MEGPKQLREIQQFLQDKARELTGKECHVGGVVVMVEGEVPLVMTFGCPGCAMQLVRHLQAWVEDDDEQEAVTGSLH